GCLMGVPFANEAQKRLLALPSVACVEVTLDHALDWKPEDMSAEYQARLAAYRSARRVALGIRLTRREEMAHRRERAQTEQERVPNSQSLTLSKGTPWYTHTCNGSPQATLGAPTAPLTGRMPG